MEPQLGQFTLSTIVAVMMGAILGCFPVVPDKVKNLVAMLLGGILSALTMIADAEPITAKLLIPHVTDGFMFGLQAIGTYNVLKKPDAVVK